MGRLYRGIGAVIAGWLVHPARDHARLAEERTLIVPDLRGVGESSIAESGYNKETVAEDVYRLVRKPGSEEVCVMGQTVFRAARLRGRKRLVHPHTAVAPLAPMLSLL
ncbi:MAG: alpha/beta hydrolase [Actinobacteria bacterium]|nr:alpha/beta hydrolase [Actinomycetota bacterium]